MKHSRTVVGAALGLLVLSLAVVGPAAAQTTAVTGTVTYLQRSALAPDSVVKVQIQDVSRADAPAEVIGEQVFVTEGKQVPLPYNVSYDPAKIVENHRYVVRARIEAADGTLLFTNDTAIPVITAGAPTENVEILVVPVAQPAQPAEAAQPAQPAETTPPATLPTTGGSIAPPALTAALGALAGVSLLLRRAR